jgi:hypothetical protein
MTRARLHPEITRRYTQNGVKRDERKALVYSRPSGRSEPDDLEEADDEHNGDFCGRGSA